LISSNEGKKMEAERVRCLISQYRNEYKKRNLDFSYISKEEHYNTDVVDGVEIRLVLPFSSFDKIEHCIASKVAHDYGLELEEYNVNRGMDEPPSHRSTFLVTCSTEKEIEENVKKILDAEKELTKRFEKVADLAK